MTWHLTGDNFLSEHIMAYFTDAYLHHMAYIDYGLSNLLILMWKMFLTVSIVVFWTNALNSVISRV